MGRPSTASCFKIITCGSSDSVDRDDLQAPEIKGSSDKRGWSFRKRSARHRVLSNSVTSETASGNKASPDSATVSFQTQPSSTAAEKASVVQWTEEKTQLSTTLDLKVTEPPAPAPENVTADITPDESAVIVIQAAIRGFLARRMLLKHKNIIKLQAAVRGHMVRRHAVGSLRCVQAIVKMQALVRQRRARLLLEASKTKKEGNVDEKHGKEYQGSVDLGKDNSETKPHGTYPSIEKLLSNGFARQLLESKPRTKTINIKCDPSKSDSAWKWLERWMSVSSVGNQHSAQIETTSEQQDEKRLEKSDCPLENEISSQDNFVSKEIKSYTEELAAPSEGDENVITYDVVDFDSDACPVASPLESGESGKSHQNTSEAKSSDDKLDSLHGQTRELDVSKMESDLFIDQPVVENEQHTSHVKRPALEEPETDGRKNLFGARKASNPAFIAAQSKFEELSSSANVARSVGSSNQDTGMGASTDAVSLVRETVPAENSSTDAVSLTRETIPAQNSLPHTSGNELGGSECGTELSISSTLDSPDRSELGVVNDVKETNNLEVGTNIANSSLNLAVNAEVESPELERDLDLSHSNSTEQEIQDNITGGEFGNDSSTKMLESNSPQTNQNPDAIETGLPLESEINCQVSKSSPGASPRSHVTVPETQETPSSQVSKKTRKNSAGKGGSSSKRRSESSGKGYPSDADHSSGARNSPEQLPKDHKTGKRRNSFGSTKTDHGDHEPRDSSSTLPSYMQATESARAKALANSSPRSSPDMQDKDFYIKKRHSLPGTGANARQGSPRVQQSASQAQQGAKGNGIHSPQERKWKR